MQDVAQKRVSAPKEQTNNPTKVIKRQLTFILEALASVD